MKLVDRLMKYSDKLIIGTGASEERLVESERRLGVKLAEDFWECLMKFGLFVYDGHEFTGITDGKRLDIVQVTSKYKTANKYIPSGWYVIEETGIDGIVIWQTENGEIYGTVYGSKPEKISDSLAEFLGV